MRKPKRMTCTCCGGPAFGRQWWNQDTGFTLCIKCVDYVQNGCREKMTDEEMARSYGVKGVHFGCEEPEVAHA